MNQEVSRETPPAPATALGVFSHRLALAERYADLLTQQGVLRGLIGPREVPRLWERHLLNCALVADAIEEGVQVCDIGSGAGLPGIVLAIRRPDLHVTLVEPLLRRTTFLTEVVDDLELANVEVVRGRAEELHGRRDFEVVTARAVAPLDRLVRWAMPLVQQGGKLVAMKGASANDEIAKAGPVLRKYGVGTVRVEEYGAGKVERPTTVVCVEATAPSRLGLGVDGNRPGKGGKQRASSHARRRRER